MPRQKLIAKEKILEYPEILTNKETFKTNKGHWNLQCFQSDAPLFIELGCGKGKFLNTLAEQNPKNNYLGLEIKEERLLSCAKKAQSKKLKNIAFLKANIAHIDDFFRKHEVSGIYINFPDPWPKRKHGKRRMTSPLFLKNYHNILKKDGFIALKTDNSLLFHYSVYELLQEKWIIEEESLNLEQSKQNIETEFEEKYRTKNLPIYYVKSRIS